MGIDPPPHTARLLPRVMTATVGACSQADGKCFSVNAAASARSAIDGGSLPSSIPLRVTGASRQHSADLEAGHSSLLIVGQTHRLAQRRTLRHRRLDRRSAAGTVLQAHGAVYWPFGRA